ncbi:hypothetical protein H5410_013519 [Solanum commersonii]|uniref:Uncharacterized protein n=1 Tax=Solanum commersonii TaxID=4109 RepID=A0A9J5ZNM8_SOLCO|nr:hypothetical protein H5410_013519 [Solanum commersonii]
MKISLPIVDEDFKRRKELGAEMRNMNHGNRQQGQDQRQVRPRGKRSNNTKAPRGTDIDSMLPIPISPISSPLIGIIEVEGGWMDGMSERHTNLLWKGIQRGICLMFCMRNKNNSESEQGNTRQIKEKQQKEVTSAGKQNKGSMAKDMGTNASTSNHGNTPKSKNKPSKKKREAAKKRQNIQQQNSAQQEKQSKEACKRFIMVDDQLGMDITPLNTQYMGSPSNVPPDKRDPDEDDETSELLIRAFSPHPDICFADEVRQVAKEQGLSPRGIHLDKFQFQNQDTNTITAGRPNTRLFTSKSAQ